jgi:hypothetical protein
MADNTKTFKEKKEDLINQISDLIEKYDAFTKEVSPSNWRMIGGHYHDLKRMKKEVEATSEITEAEKEIDWVKEQLK